MLETFSSQIMQETSSYLDKNLEPSFYAGDFCQKRFQALLEYLFELFSEERTLQNTLAIKKGMKEYFQQRHQTTEIVIQNKQLQIKKIPKKENISTVLDRALCQLDNKVAHLFDNIKDYEQHNHLKEFSKERLNDLLNCFHTLEMNICDTRVYIRESMAHYFELHKRDMIFFFTQQMYIRHFVDNTKQKERRFNNVQAETLEAIIEEFFPDDMSDRITSMVPELEDSSLNFSRMNNAVFHQSLIETCRGFMDVLILPYIQEHDEEIALALNGYILRQNFDKILAILADILLKKVLNRDKNADIFLKYYNGDTIMDQQGIKTKKRGLVDEQNNNWNYSSIFSIITQHKQAKSRFLSYKEDLDEKEKIYLQVEERCKKTEAMYKEQTQECESLDIVINENKFLYSSLRDQTLNSDDKGLRNQAKTLFNTIKIDMKKHLKCKEKISSLAIQHDNLKVEEKNRKQQYAQAKEGIKGIESTFNKLNKSYETITALLARAITGR